MSPPGPKQIALHLTMAGIVLVTGSYVGVDWASYFYHFPNSYSAGAGFVRTVLATLLVVLIGDSQVNRLDQRLLTAAFLVTIVADYFLILRDEMMIGTALFFVVHGLLIARHAQGFRASLAPGERTRTIRLLVLTGVIAYGGTAVFLGYIYGWIRDSPYFVVDCVYLGALATSLWMAWGTLIRRALPRFNGALIGLGMTMFYCCDVTVGLAAALHPDRTGRILDNLVGLFYSPALVLLAYSGVRWGAPSPLTLSPVLERPSEPAQLEP